MNKPEASILLVDDQLANLKVLLSLLQSNGYRVLVADSGERALTILDNTLPDLILLDVMMPGMDGFETCRKIKSKSQTESIPVIFMTALDSNEDKVTGFEVGGVDYVTKPFQQTEVLARIKTHIALRMREQELQKALDEVKELRGIIPICSHCKSIRDDKGYWSLLESYMSKNTHLKFSHGICPDCVEKHYSQFDLKDD